MNIKQLSLVLLGVIIIIVSVTIVNKPPPQKQIKNIIEFCGNDTIIGDSRIFTIDGGTYDVATLIIISKNRGEVLQYVQHYTDSTFTLDDLKNSEAITFTGYGAPSIWFQEMDMSVKNIAIANHELFHLSSYIMRWANIPHTEATEEAYAYQFDYLSTQFYNHIKK